MTSCNLIQGKKAMLIAETIPAVTEYKDVLSLIWESNYPDIVECTSEKTDGQFSQMIQAKKLGTAIITVTITIGVAMDTPHAYSNSFSASCEVTVSPGHLSSINPDVFWCQTGGWENFPNDGYNQCARTAVATMASINSDSVVTPNDTGTDCVSVKVKGIPYNRAGFDGEGVSSNYNLNDFKNADKQKGFNYYTFNNESEILYAINYELNNGRAVIVKTNGRDQHWVTVTDTTTGKDATCFADLMGIDPWYNGFKPPNPQIGTGNQSTDENKSEVIQLINGVQNQTDFLGYRIMTFNID